MYFSERCHRFLLMTAFVILLISLNSESKAANRKTTVSKTSRAKLGVVIVFDQLRADYLTRWQSQFVKGGFRRICESGTWFQNCNYPYGRTITAPGHASVSTGCSPRTHGIIGNQWYDRASRRVISCVAMSPYRRVPARGNRSAVTAFGCPNRLLAPTTADALNSQTNGKARIVSCSIKDRSAILSGGKRPDACYWFDTPTGEFVTSTYYRGRPHEWADRFNKAGHVNRWFGKSWQRLRKELDYEKLSGPDDVAGEKNIYSQGRTFPHPMGPKTKLPGKNYYSAVTNSPFGNELLLQFVKTAVVAEKLGTDEIPDLLCVNFSSNDKVGHTWGPDSQEVLDTTLRADLIVQDLLNFLDQKVGKGQYVVTITADHGVCPLPEVSRKKGRDSQRLSFPEIARGAEKHLRKKFGYKPSDASNCIESSNTGAFYLNRKWLKSRKLNSNTVERELARWLKTQPGIIEAFTRLGLTSPGEPKSDLERRLRLSYYPGRSGDVCMVEKPYDLLSWSGLTGTSHGSPHPYDTHVPLLVYGCGIPSGISKEKVTPQATAAIIARSLGIRPAGKADPKVPKKLLNVK